MYKTNIKIIVVWALRDIGEQALLVQNAMFPRTKSQLSIRSGNPGSIVDTNSSSLIEQYLLRADA